MRLGIFGGTFDPVHLGHLIVAEIAREQLRLDRVLFLPAARSPLKPDVEMAADHDRAMMLDLALTPQRAFELDFTDLERPAPSYTVDSLRILRQAYGQDAELWLIMGEDSLVSLPEWRLPDKILEETRLAVFDRPGHQADLPALESAIPGLRGRVDRLAGPLIAISATDIRRRAREGRSIRFQVPTEVEGYILEHGLYNTP